MFYYITITLHPSEAVKHSTVFVLSIHVSMGVCLSVCAKTKSY